MKAAILILGHLKRNGSLHGYSLMNLIDQNTSDFADLKMPTLYYHLEQLERKGMIESIAEQDGNRPERHVYSITPQGENHLVRLLDKALEEEYSVEFLLDAVFYFADVASVDILLSRLKNKRRFLSRKLADLQAHRTELLQRFNASNKTIATAIYNHQTAHLEAELNWLTDTIASLKHEQEI